MADYIVNSDRDDTEGDPALLSLREAVALANATPGVLDTIAFAEGIDLVRLTQGTQIEITDDLLILGRTGVTITGDSDGDDALVSGTDITDLSASDPTELDENTRIFLVSGAVDVTFRDLILTGGRTRFDEETGGAVSSDSPGTGATLTFQDVTIAGNETIGDRARGGGVYADAVTLRDSTISGNRTSGADSHGGGLFAFGTATLENTTVFGNETRGPGATGGGLDIGDGSLINVTVTGNKAVGTGGGLQTYQSVTSTDSIFVGNESTEEGARKDVSVGTNTGVTFTFDGRNLIGAGSGFESEPGVETAAAEDVFAQVLDGAGVLADNGGPTRTVLILAGGPAQDAGTGSREATDQRGVARPQGEGRDIGALELQETGLEVTTESDRIDPFDGVTSLREAVQTANAREGADTITFAGGVELIRLTRGTEIEITDTLTVEGGSGVTITGDAGDNDETVAGTDITDLDATDGHNLSDNTRLFNVTAAVDTTFRDLVLTGGRTERQFEGGGALQQTSGPVTLERVTLSGNETSGDFADGGALYAGGNAALTDVTISGNRTTGFDADGGGVFTSRNAALTSVTIGGNLTTGVLSQGGGHYARGSATLIDVTIQDNATTGENSSAGGLITLGNSYLTNVTIFGNSTAGNNSVAGGFGGRSDVVLTNVTISGNRTSGENAEGGGLFVQPDRTVELIDSIVLGNASATGPDEIGLRVGTRLPVTFSGSNIVGADAAAFDATVSDNVVNASPSAVFARVADGAGVLADNGGPNETVLILAGGAAQGTGRGADGPDTDQRGVARPQGEGRDIGAVELRSPPVLGDDRVILPFQSNFIRIATLLENDSDPTGAEIDPGFIQPAPFEIVGFVNLDLGLTQTAVATLAADPVGPDGAGGISVAFTYGYVNEDGVPADPAEVVVQMAAQLRLREATAEADAGGRAVVDLSALREGGFGDVTISLGPLRATDGGGGGIGSVALSGTDLVFTAAEGSEGRAGAVVVTIVDAQGQVSGATVALDVAEVADDGPTDPPPVTPEPEPEPGPDDGDGPERPGPTDPPEPGPDGPPEPEPEPDDGDGPGESPGPSDPPDTPAPEDGSGRTLLRGTEGRDRIFGTAADERFEGLGARDVLVSGGGDDLMIGGAGPDFFAFAWVNAPGTTEVADFGTRDFIVLDDQFFGLGDATIDLRGVALDQVLTAVRAGFVALDREEGTLSVDPGRDARGEAPELTIALGDGLSDLGVGDVFLA